MKNRKLFSIIFLFAIIVIFSFFYFNQNMSTQIQESSLYVIDLKNRHIDMGNHTLQFVVGKHPDRIEQEPLIYENSEITKLIDSRASVLLDGEYEEAVNRIYETSIEAFLKQADEDLLKLKVTKLEKDSTLTTGTESGENLQDLQLVIKQLPHKNLDWFLKPIEIIEYNQKKYEIATFIAIPKGRNSKMNFILKGKERSHSLEALKNEEELSVGMFKIKEKRSKLTFAEETFSCEVVNILNLKFVREYNPQTNIDSDFKLALITNRVLIDSSYDIFANTYEHQFKPDNYEFFTSFKIICTSYDNNEDAIKHFIHPENDKTLGYVRKIDILSLDTDPLLSIEIPYIQKIYDLQ